MTGDLSGGGIRAPYEYPSSTGGGIVIGMVTVVALSVLTFVLGIPAATVATVVRLWPGLFVLMLLVVGVQVGVLAESPGWFGVGREVWWAAGVVAGGAWVWFFVRVTISAWRSAYREAAMWQRAKRNIEGF